MNTLTRRIPLLYLPVISVLMIGCEEKANDGIPLKEWFDIKYEEKLQRSPVDLTLLGRKDHYDKLDDFSEEAQDELLDWYEASVAELTEKFDYDELTQDEQISYDLWMHQYNEMKEGIPFRNMNYIFHQMEGIHILFPHFMINFHRVDSLSDMQAYISRIQQSGRVVGQLLDRAKRQAENGILPPLFALETVLEECKGLIGVNPFTETDESSSLWSDMNTKIDALLESGDIDEVQTATLKDESKTALITHFQPAYERLIGWLEMEMNNAGATPTGVSRHTNGKAYYNHVLKVYTTTNLTADEIHDIGLSEVKRIHKEMTAIKEKTGFVGTLQEFFAFVSNDAQFFFPNTDEGLQAYLDDSRKFLDTIAEKLPDYFGTLPRAGLIVKRVEPFREQDGAAAHYFPGTPDGSRPGIYYMHLSNMNLMNKTLMETVAYHEGNPGHHMQTSIAQELESVPKFRTQYRSTVFREGWGLYAEALAKEIGGFENPYYDFGRLVGEVWRAIRLVVDTGLHVKGWTEADAVAYFSENSPVSPGVIKSEVQRYMVIPGQATAYKIGMMKIQELRRNAESELGDRFDIRAFHDTILGSGAMPLEILEKHVNQWIDSVKESA